MKNRFVCWLLTVLVCVALSTLPAVAQVTRIGALSVAGTTDEQKHAVEDRGYRVTLDDGWIGEFWFAKQLKTATKDVSGALYPEVANGEFVGVVNLAKGMTDFRGQAIPVGAYTLRYQLLPQDGDHLGVSPNPDFLLAIPAANDTDPEQNLPFKKLVALSAQSTGTNHPAVIALNPAGEPGSVVNDASMTMLTIAVSTSSGATERLGILVKGTAAQ